MSLQELPPSEQQLTLEVCAQLLAANTSDHLLDCINGRLKRLIPHNGVVCGIGNIHPDGLEPQLLLTTDFPHAYLSKITMGGRLRPKVINYWAKARRPLALDFSQGARDTVSESLNADAAVLGLRNMLCHGQEDGGRISYLTFIRIDDEITECQKQILSLTTPLLHDAMRRTLGEESVFQRDRLSKFSWADTACDAKGQLDLRKKQILYLIGLGKTNWEISIILDTSVDNVKYHIKKIKEAFQTTSRSAVIVEAIRCGEMPKDWPQDHAVTPLQPAHRDLSDSLTL